MFFAERAYFNPPFQRRPELTKHMIFSSIGLNTPCRPPNPPSPPPEGALVDVEVNLK